MPSFDLAGAATTASKTVNKVLSDTGVAKGLSAASNSITSAANAIKSGLSVNISNITSSLPGVAELENAIQQAKSNVNKLGNLAENATKAVTQVALEAKPPFPNILHQYASYNYIFTLSVLDDASLNFPNETYRKGMLGPIILKSANGNPSDRVPTANKTKSNPDGSFDFYIEDVQINSSVGFDKSTGNTNATGLKFKLIEPYSMGMFFQTLQVAAKNAGHTNYLEMPLLLSVEFKGHIDADLQNVQIDKTTKYFPIRLYKFGMRATGKGAEYDISAFPVNEKAYSKVYSELKTDVAIAGKNVGEMLQTGEKSLQAVLNTRLQEAVKRKDVVIADQILISFPKDLKTGDANPPSNDSSNSAGATVNPNSSSGGGMDLFKKLGVKTSSINKTQVQDESEINDIGKSTMGFNLYNKGSTPFAKDNLAFDEKTGTYKRGAISINPESSEFKFTQGSDIVNAINQVILMSEYGRTALSQITPEGTVQWWRVETHLYYIPSDENIKKTGVKPKLVVYRIVPYAASASAFLPPNTPNPGTEKAKEQVIKEYNYIYTGKNLDVMDFDIEFNASFFTQMSADAGKNSGDKEQKANAGAGVEGDPDNKTPDGEKPKEGQIPSTVLKDGIMTLTGGKGGGGLDDNASIAARQFHDSITSNTSMINLNLTILGDPYYLGDSGMGNYSAVATDNKFINADGAMNYQSGRVLINVNFRTPIDINLEDGVYDFSTTAGVPQFSGLYLVTLVTSNFRRGKFTQTLKLNRLPNQEVKSTKPPQTATTPTENEYTDPDAETTQAELEAWAAEGPQSAPITDDEIAANNASLGDFAG
jgi:hypothetical protein